MDGNSAEDGTNMITLYIKGGVNHTVGDCPLCQRVYMVLKLKDLNFRVMAINTKAPPQEYKAIAGPKKPPILVDGEAVYFDLAEMVDYLDASYQKSLQPKDKETHNVGIEVFIALSKYLKNKDDTKNEKLKTNLMKKLLTINDALEINGGPFLDGEVMTLPDCNLLPKLYHVEVCGRRISEKGYVIPEAMTNIHRYLEAFKNSEVFEETKVEESEIEYGWRQHRML